MYILGLNCYGHDSSATLLKNGVPVCAIEEERIVRKKHVGCFPANAIDCCLKEAGISGDSIDHVGFYWNPCIHRFKHLLHMVRYFPASLNLLSARRGNAMALAGIKDEISAYLGIRKGRIHYVEHHLAHASSAFFVSPFDDAAIFSYDGVGEWATTLYAVGHGNRIDRLGEVYFPHSLGDLYTMVTEFCGFSHSGGEGKLMGLASYGDPNRFYEQIRSMVTVKPNGQYRLDTTYLHYHTHGKFSWYSPKFQSLLGVPPREKESEMSAVYQDIAAAVQKVVEDVAVELLTWFNSEVKNKNLCIGGGVGLNSVANTKILERTPFEELFVQPASNDASGSLGSAFYVHNQIQGNKRTYVMNTAYLGPTVPDEEHRKAAEDEGLTYMELEREALIEKVASLLAEQKIVGWFQGGMEYGPRALGNRSILTAPFPKSMIDTLNLRVKHREPFRPFAPSVLFEKQEEYFESGYISPFMLLVYPTKKEKYDTIAAVDHVDHTGRVQSVRREDNALYYDLIKRFGEKTGVDVLLNTSFNRRGEPIVHTSEQAIDCFLGEDMDALILGSIVLEKKDVPEDKLRIGGAKELD